VVTDVSKKQCLLPQGRRVSDCDVKSHWVVSGIGEELKRKRKDLKRTTGKKGPKMGKLKKSL
jgi:hypothetical protein